MQTATKTRTKTNFALPSLAVAKEDLSAIKKVNTAKLAPSYPGEPRIAGVAVATDARRGRGFPLPPGRIQAPSIRSYSRLFAVIRTKIEETQGSICVHPCPSVVKIQQLSLRLGRDYGATGPQFVAPGRTQSHPVTPSRSNFFPLFLRASRGACPGRRRFRPLSPFVLCPLP